jgi:nucleoside-diphosphate-sugar epimerase
MKILVTGANGFVGRALCEQLKVIGHEVVPAVRRASNIPNAIILQEDDHFAWKNVLQGCEAIIHLAGRAHVMQEQTTDPIQAYRQANVVTTLKIARQAVECGVKRFIFLSTIKVNGESTLPEQFFTPEDIPNPQDPYAVSKWEAENLLKDLAKETGLEVVIIRPPLVYGPGVKGNFAKLIQLVPKGIPLPFGAIENQRSMIALENLLDVIIRCADTIKYPHLAGEVFLVSDGKPLSTKAILQEIALAYGLKLRLISIPSAVIRFLLSVIGKASTADRILGELVIDDQKTRDRLDWQPVITIREQLRKMANATHI